MGQTPRTVGSINRSYLIAQILVFAVIIGLLYFLLPLPSEGVALLPLLVGAALYIIWSRLVPLFLLRHHRTGMQFLRAGVYPQAIQSLRQSYDLFARYPWLDNLRWITLLSPSSIGYREMALNNIGFAYLQLGKNADARQYYEKLLQEFPEAATADAAREVIARIDARKSSKK